MSRYPLPHHYIAALNAIAKHIERKDEFEYYSDELFLYVCKAPDSRPDLRGKTYLEVYEKVTGGITHLNAWVITANVEFRGFFRALGRRREQFFSPRPYQLGQACDGTIGSPVCAAFKKACEALGFDASDLYEAAYPDEKAPDWVRCEYDAIWQGGIAVSGRWDQKAVAGLSESLTEVNYHMLREVFEKALRKRS